MKTMTGKAARMWLTKTPRPLTRQRAHPDLSPRADFDPAVLPDAAATYAALAVRRLQQLSS